LNARALEGHLVSYMESGHMSHIYIPSECKVDTFHQVKLEPSLFYTSVNIHTSSLPEEVDTPLTTLIPLRPYTPTPAVKTTTSEPQITLPPLPQQSKKYKQFTNKDSESERVLNEPSAGSSTPPPHAVPTPSALRSCCRKDFLEVPETPKLDHKSYT